MSLQAPAGPGARTDGASSLDHPTDVTEATHGITDGVVATVVEVADQGWPTSAPRPSTGGRRLAVLEDVDGVVTAAARMLCLGLIGLWWSRPAAQRRRRALRRVCDACRAKQRWQRTTLFVVTGVLLVLSLGSFTVQRLVTPAHCLGTSTSTTAESAGRWADTGVDLVTAPSTGAGLAYAASRGGETCTERGSGLVLAHAEEGFPRSGVTIGRVFITNRALYGEALSMPAMLRHEQRHSEQWTVVSALAGPAALPLSYGATELVLPIEQNPFERDAGLIDGGYASPEALAPTRFGVLYVFVFLVLAVTRRALPLLSTRHSGDCLARQHRRRDQAAERVVPVAALVRANRPAPAAHCACRT